MAQTPQQRRANAKFAKQEEQKRGKPFAERSKKEVQKASISGLWIALLAFAVCGGIVFELIRLFF